MGLLGHLGLTHASSHKAVLESARHALLDRIPKLSPEKLQQLLELTFAYLGIPELRAVPLAVLERCGGQLLLNNPILLTMLILPGQQCSH